MKGKIIVLGNRKGGVGKTTSIIVLADYLAALPGAPKVAVCDIDDQLSLFQDYQFAMEEERPIKWECFTPYPDGPQGQRDNSDQIIKDIAELQEEFDYLLIDVPGKLEKNDEHYRVLEMADKVFVPVLASTKDFTSSMSYTAPLDAIAATKPAQARGFKYYVFLNRYAKRHTRSNYIKKNLESLCGKDGEPMTNPLGMYDAINGVRPGTNLHKNHVSSVAALSAYNWCKEVHKIIADEKD